MGYTCSSCGKVHNDLPDIGADKPDHWFSIPESERAERCKLTPDLCEIDNQFFFVRGVIQIPVRDYDRDFGLGVWVSHKRENFETYAETFRQNNSIVRRILGSKALKSEPKPFGPFFGWLDTSIRGFPETKQLKTNAHYREKEKLRPRIELEPTDHPLAVAQREGIGLDEAWRIIHLYLPSD